MNTNDNLVITKYYMPNKVMYMNICPFVNVYRVLGVVMNLSDYAFQAFEKQKHFSASLENLDES